MSEGIGYREVVGLARILFLVNESKVELGKGE